MSGAAYDAATLERWNVVNRVLPDDKLHTEGMHLAERLAAGPTVAHTATKRIARAYLEGGVDAADRVTPRTFADLFTTQDLQDGFGPSSRRAPGKATFQWSVALTPRRLRHRPR